MRFAILYRLLGIIAVLAVSSGLAAPSIARWSGNKAAAMSLTLDDSHPVQIKYAVQEMDKRNVRGTFYVVTWNREPDGGWYRPDWAALGAAALAGHEIGGHSLTHNGAVAEVKPCIDTLIAHFPAKTWFTWAYPGGDNSAAPEVAKYTIAARSWGDDNGVESADPADYFDVKAINGWSNPYPAVDNRIWIQATLSSGGWGVETIHCIAGPGEACDLALTFQAAQFGAHLDTMLKFQNRVWIAPLGDVVRYSRERRCATVTVAATSPDSIRMTLTDTLSGNAVYDVPLTIKLPLQSGWTDCSAIQAGRACTTTIVGDTALIDAVPDAGEILVRRLTSTAGSGVRAHASSRAARPAQHLFRFDGRRAIPGHGRPSPAIQPGATGASRARVILVW